LIEFVIFVIVGLIVLVGALLHFAPSMRGRGHYDPREKNIAEAKTGLTFQTDDDARAAEYEHRFSGSRTGMMQNRRGYKIKKRRRL